MKQVGLILCHLHTPAQDPWVEKTAKALIGSLNMTWNPPPAKSSTKKHSLVILRHDLDAAAIHWTRTGFIFVHAGPNLCQLILKSAQWCLPINETQAEPFKKLTIQIFRWTSPAKILERKFAKWMVQNFSDFLTSRHLYQQWFEQKKTMEGALDECTCFILIHS